MDDSQVKYFGEEIMDFLSLESNVYTRRKLRLRGIFAVSLFLFLLGTVQASRWSRTGNVTVATRGPEGVLLTDGKYMKIGGDNVSSYEVFDPATGRWWLAGLPINDIRGHVITILLPNGKVLFATRLGPWYLYDAFTKLWSVSTVNTTECHWRSCATLLKNGKVLMMHDSTGVCGLYDCWTDRLSPTGATRAGHIGGSEVLLPDGRVLAIAGDWDWKFTSRRCDIYDPISGTWSVTDDVNMLLCNHVSILLPSGKVLLAGGYEIDGYCEIYDPATGNWSLTSPLGHFARSVAAMALLPSGEVLIAGGANASSAGTEKCELYDFTAGAWSFTDDMQFKRCHFSLVTLPTGKQLAVERPFSEFIGDDSPECEIYDPSNPYWRANSSLNQARCAHTATPIPIIHTQVCSTNILVAGGEGAGGLLKSCELYNYDLDVTAGTGDLNVARSHHTAVLLPSGEVLVSGGMGLAGDLNSCEVYDAATESWTLIGDVSQARFDHTATLLTDGRVLITGGQSAGGSLGSCELYDPGTGNWSATGNLGSLRTQHTAVLLLDGKVLVVGGSNVGGAVDTSEIWDPGTGNWTTTGSLSTARHLHGSILLQSGKVLTIGGTGLGGAALSSCEIYNPTSGSWTTETSLSYPRCMHNSTLIYSGLVLVAGGYDGVNDVLASEIYDPATHEWRSAGSPVTARHYGTCNLIPSDKPYVVAIGGKSAGAWISSIERHDFGLEYRSEWQSTITNCSRVTRLTHPMHVEGTLFRGISEADGGNHCHIVSNDHPIMSFVRVGGGNWQGNGGGALLYMPLSSSWSETHTDVDLPADSGYYELWSIVNGIPCKWGEECVGVEQRTNSQLSTGNGQLSIYPNPSRGNVNVRFASRVLGPGSEKHITHYTSHITLAVHDLSGRLVRSFPFSATGGQITTRGLNPGVYFCSVGSGSTKLRSKFTIVK